jgi:hypothetical protein
MFFMLAWSSTSKASPAIAVQTLEQPPSLPVRRTPGGGERRKPVRTQASIVRRRRSCVFLRCGGRLAEMRGWRDAYAYS